VRQTQQARRPAVFGDTRGLTTAGATILVLVLSGLAAGVDVATGTGLRTVFTVTFMAAAALSTATVHIEDLFASVVLVPLTFALVAGVSGLVEGSGFGTLTKLIEAAAIVMVNAAPALLMATMVALIVAGARGYLDRRRPKGRRLAGRAYS
jgi:hypothetical protein